MEWIKCRDTGRWWWGVIKDIIIITAAVKYMTTTRILWFLDRLPCVPLHPCHHFLQITFSVTCESIAIRGDTGGGQSLAREQETQSPVSIFHWLHLISVIFVLWPFFSLPCIPNQSHPRYRLAYLCPVSHPPLYLPVVTCWTAAILIPLLLFILHFSRLDFYWLLCQSTCSTLSKSHSLVPCSSSGGASTQNV